MTPRMHRTIGMLSAGFAFLGVALGALGAHGLKASVEGLADAADRIRWWETAARYHLVHALALGLTAIVAHHVTTRAPRIAAGLFIAGIAVFSGSLYVMGLTGFAGSGRSRRSVASPSSADGSCCSGRCGACRPAPARLEAR